jgi:hypothetical protein
VHTIKKRTARAGLFMVGRGRAMGVPTHLSFKTP